MSLSHLPSQGGIRSLPLQVFRKSIQASSWEEAWCEYTGVVICWNILELNRTFMHHIMYEVIPNLYVLPLVVKCMIH